MLYCYSASGNGKEPQLQMENPGEKSGFSLILDTQQEDYLPFTDTAGFKVLVHDHNEPPQEIENYGIAVPPGYKTFIALHKHKVILFLP